MEPLAQLRLGAPSRVSQCAGSQQFKCRKTSAFGPWGIAPEIVKTEYVSNIGNGDLAVVRADDRQTVATLDLGADVHQRDEGVSRCRFHASSIRSKQ